MSTHSRPPGSVVSGPSSGDCTLLIPYENFVREPDGSWRPLSPMIMDLPGSGKISVGPWLTFRRGRKLLGHDIAAELDAIDRQQAQLRLGRAA